METDGKCLIQGGPSRMILVALTLISAYLVHLLPFILYLQSFLWCLSSIKRFLEVRKH